MVPSKWAITATNSIIIRHLEKKLKDYKTIEKVFVFNKKFYGNDFYIIVFPGNLNYELLEAILPGSAYNLKYNFPIIGRDDESGGYYAGNSVLGCSYGANNSNFSFLIILFLLITIFKRKFSIGRR